MYLAVIGSGYFDKKGENKVANWQWDITERCFTVKVTTGPSGYYNIASILQGTFGMTLSHLNPHTHISHHK